MEAYLQVGFLFLFMFNLLTTNAMGTTITIKLVESIDQKPHAYVEINQVYGCTDDNVEESITVGKLIEINSGKNTGEFSFNLDELITKAQR